MAPLTDSAYRANVILGWSTLHFAEETESWESVETLLNGGASTRELFTTKKKLKDPLRAPTVVREICRRGCLKLLRFALSEYPDLVHTKLDMGRTLLHVAAQAGSSVAVRCLLDYPVDVNAVDGRGVTPLHEAAAHCDSHVLMLLLKAGANAQARDVGGRTALHYAASGGSASGIRVLLAEGLAPDVESTNGCSPLHEAAASSNHHCVQMLLNAGADLHMATNKGWTALHWAASEGTCRSLRMLIEAGIPVGVKTQEDETPLHLAAERGDSDMVALLVSHGADVEALDRAGKTPAKRASDRVERQKEEARKVEESKQCRRQKETGNSSQKLVTATYEKTKTERRSGTLRSGEQGDNTELSGDVEGSEYSYQSESEIIGQRYSDEGSDFEEENYSPETASGGSSARDKPPSLLSIETNVGQYDSQGHGRAQRGKYRGRGRGNYRGHKSASRGGGHVQSQEGKHGYSREYTQPSGEAQNSGNVQQKEPRHRQRNRHHQAKEGEARKEYNSQSNSRESRSNEQFSYPVTDDIKKKHPFSKYRQSDQSVERNVPQNMITNTGSRNLQKREAYGSTDQIHRSKTDQINRQENRSGGTFLDELRYLQEKLAFVDAGTRQPNQSGNGPPKPELPPKPGFLPKPGH